MAEEQDSNRDFVPVESPSEALNLLRMGVKHAASAILWTANQEKTLKTHVSALTNQNQRIHVWQPNDLDMRGLHEEILEKGLLDWYFSVSLPAANIFFKARYEGFDAAGIKFQAPPKIYKVQRRKDFRYTIPEGYVLKVDFDDPLMPGTRMTQKALDLSAGGLSLVVRPDEAPLFQQGSFVRGIRFKLHTKEITCDAIIRHVRDLPPDSRKQGTKVGLQFTKLAPADAQTIATYVFEETRKYVSKLF